MATTVFTSEEIELQDGTEVEIRGLPIAKLRKFHRLWSEHLNSIADKVAAEKEHADDEDAEKYAVNPADLTDEQYDVFIKMCALGLSKQLQGDLTDKKFLDHLEEVLDEATIFKILDVTGGLKFGNNEDNPNLVPTMTPAE